jgi:hypothetical protein
MAKRNPKSYTVLDALHAVKTLVIVCLVVAGTSAVYGIAKGIAYIAFKQVTGQ